MKIGKIDLGDRPALLAPMEDVTDIGFRLLCRRMGAAMVYSEFVAADALVRLVNKSLKKLEVCEEERPVAIQIYGKEPGPMADAARIVVEQAHPDVLDLNPQYVFIMAGTNDVAENNGKITLENILGNLKSMVELAKAHNIRPILCSVPPAAGFVWRKDLSPAKDIIKLNKMIKEYADSINIPYIDYHSLLTDENGGLPKKYAKDGVHPVLAGYKLMEGLLLEEFKKIDK